MRNAACTAWRQLFAEQRYVFLTGDLGFMALESLRDDMGECLINASFAEQKMVSVAAGLAKAGLEAWVYSIAPFIYARPFEQIRNDVCLNRLPVRLAGNGGAYAYGSMGSSHHAIEDYGVLLGLQGTNVIVPARSWCSAARACTIRSPIPSRRSMSTASRSTGGTHCQARMR